MSDLTEVVQSTPKAFDFVNIGYGAVVGILTMLLGDHWMLFAGFLVMEVIDWISGNYKARILKRSSSVVGAIGAMKKVW